MATLVDVVGAVDVVVALVVVAYGGAEVPVDADGLSGRMLHPVARRRRLSSATMIPTRSTGEILAEEASPIVSPLACHPLCSADDTPSR